MQKKQFQVAAIDLDDTLIRTDRTISERTLTALRQWRSHGNRLVIATGRPPRSIGHAIPAELHDIPWISYNGAEIHQDGQSIYRNWIPAADTCAIVQELQHYGDNCVIGLEVDNQLYLSRAMPRPSPYQVADLLSLEQPAAKILLFNENPAQPLPIITKLPSSARAMYSTRYTHFVQILAHNADKVEALRVLVEGWGLTLGAVVAFGDDTNDVEMVRQSGLGVAMSNAVDEVKAVANCVTTSNDEDGVAQILERLLDIVVQKKIFH